MSDSGSDEPDLAFRAIMVCATCSSVWRSWSCAKGELTWSCVQTDTHRLLSFCAGERCMEAITPGILQTIYSVLTGGAVGVAGAFWLMLLPSPPRHWLRYYPGAKSGGLRADIRRGKPDACVVEQDQVRKELHAIAPGERGDDSQMH